MTKMMLRRTLALLMCLCLLPVCALGEAAPEDGAAAAPAADSVEAAATEETAGTASEPVAEEAAGTASEPEAEEAAGTAADQAAEETAEPTDEQTADPADEAVTRSRFTAGLQLHADAFPADGLTDFQGWETLLNKLKLTGTVDTQRLFDPFKRIYLDGDLLLNDRSVIPFIFDGYYNYHYIRSAAINGQSIHFQMNNFLEFMLKPYYFLGLPTQYIGLLMYPEATTYMVQSYYGPLKELCAGTGNRQISYVQLYELCEELNIVAIDDPEAMRVYYYLTALLTELQMADSTFEAMCQLDSYLDFLDPTQDGMTITVTGNTETYRIGEYTLLTLIRDGDKTAFTLTLPSPEGMTLQADYHYGPQASGADAMVRVKVMNESEQRISLELVLTGLPREGDTQSVGKVRFTAGGSALGDVETRVAFDFSLLRSASEPPYQADFRLDWIHPVTQKPALTLNYLADIEMHGPEALSEHLYDNLIDFFHLNESYIEEYKRAFAVPMALAVAPIILEMPAGVINDILRFCDNTGVLAMLGIE